MDEGRLIVDMSTPSGKFTERNIGHEINHTYPPTLPPFLALKRLSDPNFFLLRELGGIIFF